MSDGYVLHLNAAPMALGIPHIEDYFGPWAVYQERFQALLNFVSMTDLAEHVAQQQAQEPEPPPLFENRSGVAVINLMGTLTKRGSSLSVAGSTLRARRAIRLAVADSAVSSVLLLVESPGGTVSGVQELVNDITAANEAGTPVTAYIEDIGASAAYWIASAADKVYANTMAHVGSIGVYTVLEDSSGAAEEAGIRVHVVRAGEFKGMGTPGTPVTDAQLAEVQRIINSTNTLFVNDVARNRGLEQALVNTLADGRVFLAAEAQELGLIDGVRSLESVLEEMSAQTVRKPTMSDSNEPVVAVNAPATLLELKQEFPKASAEWREAQLLRAATLDDARTAWQLELEAKLESTESELVAARETTQLPPVVGNDAVSDLPADADPTAVDSTHPEAARAEWESLVDDQVEELKKRPSMARKSPMDLRALAMRKVHERNPGLAEAVNPELTKLYGPGLMIER